MKLSIVITTRNRKESLMACVKSIKSSNLEGIDLELIVVDDASSDGTQILDSKDLQFSSSKIIHSSKKLMMVSSRNIGALEASGDYILFIDDDNEIDRGMIEILMSFADKHSEYGIIGPSNYYFDSKIKYMDYQKINLFTGQTIGIVSTEVSEVFESDGIPNVFMVRRVVFDECGYFDENLIQTFTEPDFAARIKKCGYKCGVVPKAKTYHKVKEKDNYKPRSMGGMFNQKAYCLIRNRTVYIFRYGAKGNKLVYTLFFSWLWPLIYSLIIIPHGRFDIVSLYWKGFIDGVKFMVTNKLVNSLKYDN